jgi:hypothetical protein
MEGFSRSFQEIKRVINPFITGFIASIAMNTQDISQSSYDDKRAFRGFLQHYALAYAVRLPQRISDATRAVRTKIYIKYSNRLILSHTILIFLKYKG